MTIALVALSPNELRALRQRAHMSQADVARALRIHVRWYRTMETDRGLPPHHLEALMAAIEPAITRYESLVTRARSLMQAS